MPATARYHHALLPTRAIGYPFCFHTIITALKTVLVAMKTHIFCLKYNVESKTAILFRANNPPLWLSLVGLPVLYSVQSALFPSPGRSKPSLRCVLDDITVNDFSSTPPPQGQQKH
eukprot:4306773-Amphidinium_carterae.1